MFSRHKIFNRLNSSLDFILKTRTITDTQIIKKNMIKYCLLNIKLPVTKYDISNTIKLKRVEVSLLELNWI